MRAAGGAIEEVPRVCRSMMIMEVMGAVRRRSSSCTADSFRVRVPAAACPRWEALALGFHTEKERENTEPDRSLPG